MIFHRHYTDIPRAEIDRFVHAQELGRHLHLVRRDEQIADLRARPRCLFEVDEVLAVIPSYWVHAEYAGSATAYHRTVLFECAATVIEEPAAVAAQQRRLLARYQPEGGYRTLDPADPLYKGALDQLAAVRLTIAARRVKFKLGQNRPEDTRRRVIGELRKGGRAQDARAADALEWTIDGQGVRGPVPP